MNQNAPENFDLAGVTVRVAEERDHAVIRELFYAGLIAGAIDENDTGADIENLQQGYFSDDGNSRFWVAEHDGHIVGTIGVQRTAKNAGEIRRMRVREGFRRRGIGTRLIEHALRFCRDQSHLKVTLDVRAERRPAIALIEKCGFQLDRTKSIEDQPTLDFYLDLYSDPAQD